MDISFGFDDFATELGELEIRKTRKFDRVWKIGHGGSIASPMVIHKNMLLFGALDSYLYCVNADNGKNYGGLEQVTG
ncbi:MAG TPA: hypothetical protein ENG42_00990 [Candidatus Aenigmarchaeota archaeon]|nr:MAG: hypothetical protein DRP03_03595 [Candidatus Aenigmarchaeota archaeon]HDD46026.1 hypothetical protein [Candidatus Aenigmarchaeota archaeon]